MEQATLHYIDLGHVSLQLDSSYLALRHKLKRVADMLQFEEHTVSRLVGVCSEMCRLPALRESDKYVGIVLANDGVSLGLVVDFAVDAKLPVERLQLYFDEVWIGSKEEPFSGIGVQAYKRCPYVRAKQQMTGNLLHALRDCVSDPSREELMSQLERNNKELAKQRDDLEQTVLVRTRELQDAFELAQSANAAKSHFLANMSHELRTPLNAVIGYSGLLIEELEELEPQECVGELEKILGASRHLLQLIDGILDLSKIEAGSMELVVDRFEVSTFLFELQMTMQPLFEKHANQFELQCEGDLGILFTDSVKLRQCLLNLLSNASKFAANNRVVLRAFSSTEDGEPWVCFEVIDEGIGIPEAKMQHLFTAFEQLDPSTTRRFGGTGLGLALTQRLVRLLGGHISVESEHGKGSTFSLSIPVMSGSYEPVSMEL
jgi:signal transduction histidine kinase